MRDGPEPVYLDTCEPLTARVGYGSLGLQGDLGYEEKDVVIQGQSFAHALSTHPPARLRYRLNGNHATFRCRVAINDDVPAGISHANFIVRAGSKRVALATNVVAGETPRPLVADVAGAPFIELEVQTTQWPYCHAVWLEPELSDRPVTESESTLIDCLGRIAITLPSTPPSADRCIATVVSPGFEGLLDDMLGSLYAYGGCRETLLVVFVVGESAAARRIIDKYGAVLIQCRPHARVNATVKAALYSVAQVIDARSFICLDADMLVLGDLSPAFAAIEACPANSIFAVREGNARGWHTFNNLRHALTNVYGGRPDDIKKYLGMNNGAGAYELVVNDGLFAGSRTALLALDKTIREMPRAAQWTDARRDIWWRNQFVFNLALAHMDCGVPLDNTYNVQLNSHEVYFREHEGRIRADWFGEQARVLHFNGLGRNKYSQWRNLFAAVPDPLVNAGGGDGYSAFLHALRGWIGLYGRRALAWSFYGTQDSYDAQVADPDTFPLLALLHYLLRANGCVRVLETGTARGVSAACLASAVAHRPGARVVSFDPAVMEEREALWQALPAAAQAVIEPRQQDSLAGMAAAIAAGESYDAALLDSLHEADHIWAEFELAVELVCPGGLILVHDVQLADGNVAVALQRIEAAGYGVTRLWTAECGIAEDDGLGLAVIENRRREKADT